MNTNIIPHKMPAARFEYEYLGKSIKEIALAYSYPEEIIEKEIASSEWERKIEPTSLPQTKNIQEFANSLEEITRSKLSIISLFRQIENQPLIAQLEKVFLEKALILADSLNEFDEKASQKLATLVKSVNQLQERNPIDLADQLKDISNQGNKVVVNIANSLQ